MTLRLVGGSVVATGWLAGVTNAPWHHRRHRLPPTRSRHRTLRRRRFGHWLHPCCLHPHRPSHPTIPSPPSVRQHTSPVDSRLEVADFLRALEPRMTACTLVAAELRSTSAPSTSESLAPAGISTRAGLSLRRAATSRVVRGRSPRQPSKISSGRRAMSGFSWDFPIQHVPSHTADLGSTPTSEITCAPRRGGAPATLPF